MNEPTPKQQRLALIEAKRSEAAVILPTANHSTMKGLVRLAVRDLDQGLVWLRQQNVDDNAWILGMVDHDIQLATFRLRRDQRGAGPRALSSQRRRRANEPGEPRSEYSRSRREDI
jgi:hypothetical protein